MFLRFFYIHTCLNWSLHFFDNSLQISLLKPFLWVILITFKSMKYKYETLTWLDFSPAVQDCPKCPPPVFPASPGVSVCWLGYKCTSYSAKITWWIIQKTDPLKGFQSFEEINHLRNDTISGNRKRLFQLLFTIVSREKITKHNQDILLSSFGKVWEKGKAPAILYASVAAPLFLSPFQNLFISVSSLLSFIFILFSPPFLFYPFSSSSSSSSS